MSASRFEALLEVSDMIACARDLKELLRQLAPALKKVVDFDYVANVARQTAVEVSLCNCIAFGSKNSAIVVRKGAST